jgi:hypothetical protein
MTECEPYLADYAVSFHQVFTLIDPAMNTSEIKPLHLSVPRTRGSIRPPPSTNPPPEKLKPEEPTSGRFLQHFANAKRDTPSTSPNRPNVLAQALVKPPSRPPPSSESTDSKIQTDSLLKNEDFWLFALSPSFVLRFQFKVDSASTPWVFRMFSDPDSQLLMTATMNGSARTSGIRISARDREIGEGKWDKAAGAFFAGVSLGSDRGEACSAIYNNKSFVFVIPAIKKIEGKPRMCQIAMGETSELCTLANRNAKEAIRLKNREPPGGDLTFEGKFEQATPANFQLFHDSNAKRNLCCFGMNNQGEYILEVSYPLSPVQGFLAAVSATMP